MKAACLPPLPFLSNLYISQQSKMGLQISAFLWYMTAFFSLTPSSTPTNLPSSSPTHRVILQRFGNKAKGHTVPAAELWVHHPWQCRLPWLIRASSSSPECLCVGVGSVLGSQQGILPLALYSLLLYRSQPPPQPLNISWELAAQAHKSTCELNPG